MKYLFYTGLAGLFMYELLRTWLIMPMPGSQTIESINLAYFIYSWRWIFRTLFLLVIALGSIKALKRSPWKAIMSFSIFVSLISFIQLYLSAEKMFISPRYLAMADWGHNVVVMNRLVLGVEINGQARAYPIQYIAYHHQVTDTVGGKPIMVTYCSVCRTGRVFEPTINGRQNTFRLVGMDHFNAMFEDKSTGTWWRQVDGEAVAGPLKGQFLPEVESRQMTLAQWLALYPQSLVMQPDPSFAGEYIELEKYEDGKGGKLTGTDKHSWRDKSWVLGVESGDINKAYDWNAFCKKRLICDSFGRKKIVVMLAEDAKSFAGFEYTGEGKPTLEGNMLKIGDERYDMAGRPEIEDGQVLKAVKTCQEFWHSWRYFHN